MWQLRYDAHGGFIIIMALYLHLAIFLLSLAPAEGEEFLLALPTSSGGVFVTAVAGGEEGTFQVHYPQFNETETFDLRPYSRKQITIPNAILTSRGLENKTILVNTSDSLSVFGYYKYGAVSLVPVTVLGMRYVLPSCGSSSVLVIASHNKHTNIRITFRLKTTFSYQGKTFIDGDFLTLTLEQYQSFTFKFTFDITGTTMETSEPVAVFMGSIYRSYISSYDQILPINAHGTEYVVTVDDDSLRYQLQIVGYYNDNAIIFNDGTKILSQFYKQSLERNSTVHFTTSRPVMTTLCRVYEIRTGFLVVPPTSSYSKQIALYPLPGDTYTIKVLTRDYSNVSVEQFSTQSVVIDWHFIPSSGYKTGTCRIPPGYSTSFKTHTGITTLAYHTNHINNGGYTFSGSKRPNHTDFQDGTDALRQNWTTGEACLLALPTSYDYVYVTATVGEKAGSIAMWYPNLDKKQTFHLGPFSRKQISVPSTMLAGHGVENKSIIVNKSNKGVRLSVSYKYAAFSSVPISALGTRYILPFCGQSSVFVIATHDMETDVHITFRLHTTFSYGGKTYIDGDVLSLTLQKYQTFTFKFTYDVTGTVIQTTEPVAVFMGTIYKNYISSYDQLLPVSAHGKEYVVAVDDDNLKYHLQIVSDYSDNEIDFQNGTTIFTQFHRELLDRNASLYFTSTRPVMTTLCRVYEIRSAFVVVPMLSSYTRHPLSLYPNSDRNYLIKIFALKAANVTVQRYFDPRMFVLWQNVSNGTYKVGTCKIPSQFSTSFRSDAGLTFLAFDQNVIHNGGFSFPNKGGTTTPFPGSSETTDVMSTTQTPTYLEGGEYLIALPTSYDYVYITAAVGENGGSFSVWYPNLDKNQTFHLGPYSRKQISVSSKMLTSSGVENKSVIVTKSNDGVSISTSYKYAAFSSVPISVLGTRYILPFCGQISVFVIATHDMETDVHITFRLHTTFSYGGKTYIDGDVLSLTLQKYQTFTFKFTFDVTGTVIQTTEPVAVFMGTIYKNYISSYDQLLPVSAHGKEYVVAVDDDNLKYHLQIVSDYSDNEIDFQNGTTIFTQFHSELLDRNASLYFTSTRPVMTTLCRVYEIRSAFVVVPMLSSYTRHPLSLYPNSDRNYLIKIFALKVANVTVQRYFDPRMFVLWQNVPNGTYKVGTCKIPSQFSTAFSSDAGLTFLAFDQNVIHNGGFSFPNKGGTTTPVPGSSETTDVMSTTQTPTYLEGGEYLIALPTSYDYVYITAAVGENGGSFSVWYPNLDKNQTFHLGPYSRKQISVSSKMLTSSGFENKSVIVTKSNDGVSISTSYKYAAFSSVPISVLGTRYILPFCDQSSVFVIATHGMETDVHITFRLHTTFSYGGKTYIDGDVLSLTLQKYQTFTFKFTYDVTGTVIQTTEPVAVFMGTIYKNYISSYDQLLPVSVHGKEYVVAVDDDNLKYHLQIVSDYSDNEIDFQNGTTILTQFHRELLDRNASLYFTSTRPVMTTLCRVYEIRSAFVVVPMVSSFSGHPLSVYPNSDRNFLIKIIALKAANVTVQRYFDPRMFVLWQNVSNGTYKVGTCKIPSQFSTSFRSDAGLTFLAFDQNVIHNGGFSFPKKGGTTTPFPGSSETTDVMSTTKTPTYLEGGEYLIALPTSYDYVYITAAVGENGGSFSAWYPNLDKNQTFHLGPYSRKQISVSSKMLTSSGVENKSVIVTKSSDGVSISASYKYAAFSSVPISALGTRYILPFCGQSSVFVIATHDMETDVHITFRLHTTFSYGGKTYIDGDVLSLTLQKYQTFTFKFTYDVTGTVIQTTRPVAVFMGTIYKNYISSYDQLLPVSAHGKEYVVAVDDDNLKYHLQIVSDYSDNEIDFQNGTTIFTQFHRELLDRNASLYFTSTRPVMTTLCRVYEIRSAFVVVPMVTSFSRHPLSVYPNSDRNFLIKVIALKAANVTVQRYFDPRMFVLWQNVSNGTYKVGTCKIPSQFSTSFSSDAGLTFLAFDQNVIHNGGFSFPKKGGTTTPVPGSSETTDVMSTTQTPTYLEGGEYLIALPTSYDYVYITAVVGENGGSFSVWYPNLDKNQTFHLGPYSRKQISVSSKMLTSSGFENKSVIVTKSNDGVSISASYKYAAFSSVPISVLGTRYILPFCGQSSVFVIATHGMETDVHITFRLHTTFSYGGKTYIDGDVLSLTLQKYQTFTFKFTYDVTGTVIQTTQPVAVFMGTIYKNYISSYDQLLPVSAHGKEYVVAVDDDNLKYHLQIVSDYSDNEIDFQNGTTIFTQFHHALLDRNASLYFTSTRPVMTTLCRVYEIRSAFVVVPMLSSYTRHPLSLYPNSDRNFLIKVVSHKKADVCIQRYFDPRVSVVWQVVPNGPYKVGTCSILSRYSTSFSSNAGLTILAFDTNVIHSGGFNILKAEGGSTPYPGSPEATYVTSTTKEPLYSLEECLIALATSYDYVYVTAAVGEEGGSITLWYPNMDKKQTFHLGPYSKKQIYIDRAMLTGSGVENKSIIVNKSNDGVSISAGYKYATFSAVPVGALGTRYILPFCGQSSVFVVATNDKGTDVQITFRLKSTFYYSGKTYFDGDILTIRLQQYQTFTFKFSFDITGTTIQTTEPVGVFMGTIHRTYVSSYDQILPVSVLGKEYVIAVDDDSLTYTMQIVSDFSDNEIYFNNGTTIQSPFYRQSLGRNASLQFSTSRPVLTTLCRVYEIRSGFLVVPMVSSYRSQPISLYPIAGIDYLIKIVAPKLANVTVRRYYDPRIPVLWQDSVNAHYKIGTCRIPSQYSTSFSSDSGLTLLAFTTNTIHNGGYKFQEVWSPTTETPLVTQTPTPLKGMEYLLAFPTSSDNVYLRAAVGDSEGSLQLYYPHKSVKKSFNLGPFSHHQLSIASSALTGLGTENKSILVTTSGGAVSVYGYYKYGGFSPLPVAVLDVRYVLPFCGQSSVLVIASNGKKTDVRFTFRLKQPFSYGGKTYTDSDYLVIKLDPYQTFTLNIGVDVTGTLVQTTEKVAIFMGTKYRSYITSYDQILPVSAFGKEYVLSVYDASHIFHLQIVSDDIDTQIAFNNGSTFRGQFYRQTLGKDVSLSFNTSRPVMAVLFRVYIYYSGFVVLPAVASFSNQEVAFFPSAGINYVLKVITDMDANIKVKRYLDPSVPLMWHEVPNSGYKVGTCKLTPQYSTAITADSGFIVIAYHGNFILNGRYRNATEDDLTVFPESTTPAKPTSTAASTSSDWKENTFSSRRTPEYGPTVAQPTAMPKTSSFKESFVSVHGPEVTTISPPATKGSIGTSLDGRTSTEGLPEFTRALTSKQDMSTSRSETSSVKDYQTPRFTKNTDFTSVAVVSTFYPAGTSKVTAKQDISTRRSETSSVKDYQTPRFTKNNDFTSAAVVSTFYPAGTSKVTAKQDISTRRSETSSVKDYLTPSFTKNDLTTGAVESTVHPAESTKPQSTHVMKTTSTKVPQQPETNGSDCTNDNTALIVGLTLGFVIIVLLVIIVELVYYIRRKTVFLAYVTSRLAEKTQSEETLL